MSCVFSQRCNSRTSLTPALSSDASKKGGDLAVGDLYALLLTGGVAVPYASFFWENFAPSKAKFFAWLLLRAWIQSRAVLLRKHILTAEEAGCAVCGETLETADHIIFGRSFTKAFWSAIGWSLLAGAVLSSCTPMSLQSLLARTRLLP
ncbi:hypothetical protein QYE76_008744 [Lolium multiflorum]|jgi:hypothetical protein|uniref:Reverse transcriptase zinc-binding domain-containing protein n=1 Tax=Lolium multiflorum TaxID=4521 RepID=A0AAD8TS97_LOLMU|nr:hypothetical protein QYE76_008744 [Lolium multiflorum]